MSMTRDEKVALATSGAVAVAILLWLWLRQGSGTQVVATGPAPEFSGNDGSLPFAGGDIPVNAFNLTFEPPTLFQATPLRTYIPLFGFIGAGGYGL